MGELSTESGNNDGMIRGYRYFRCPARKGLFVSETLVVQRLRPEQLLGRVKALQELVGLATSFPGWGIEPEDEIRSLRAKLSEADQESFTTTTRLKIRIAVLEEKVSSLGS